MKLAVDWERGVGEAQTLGVSIRNRVLLSVCGKEQPRGV